VIHILILCRSFQAISSHISLLLAFIDIKKSENDIGSCIAHLLILVDLFRIFFAIFK